jgi:hypothetical protein
VQHPLALASRRHFIHQLTLRRSTMLLREPDRPESTDHVARVRLCYSHKYQYSKSYEDDAYDQVASHFTFTFWRHKA